MGHPSEASASSMTADEHFEAGFSFRCDGDYENAKRELALALQAEPGHVKARWQIALIKQFEGDFEGSLAGLKEVAAESPNDLEVRYDYAMTMMMLGMAEEAGLEFKAILVLDPNHEKAQQQLIYCS